MLEIIPFEDRYAADFSRMNLEWLYQYKLAEDHDLEVLNDPRGTIIEPGGCIFLARENATIAGSAALMVAGEDCFELAKMSVDSHFRGRGISKMLMVRCLEEARLRGAKKLLLYSNHQLTTALQLYKQFGFKNIPVTDSPFVTADVMMELVL